MGPLYHFPSAAADTPPRGVEVDLVDSLSFLLDDMPSNDNQENCYCRKCGGTLRSKRTVRRHAGQPPALVFLNLHQWLTEPKSIEEIADSESTTESDGPDDGGEELGPPAKKCRVKPDLDEGLKERIP